MILKSFGKKIRELRKKQGISQEAFANKIGMDRTYYSSIENGKHNLSLLSIKKISDGLGIDLKNLFENLKWGVIWVKKN